MNDRIRRLSFGLAVVMILQCLGVGMAEEPIPQEPQPTVQQEQATPAPVSEPEPEKTEHPQSITAVPTIEITPAPTAAEPAVEPAVSPAIPPVEEPTAEPTPEDTEVPTAEPTAETTEEPTIAPTIEPTIEPTIDPTSEPTLIPEDTIAPVLHRFECMPDSAQVGGEGIRLEAEFSDNVSLQKIEIHVDDVLVAEQALNSAAEEHVCLIYQTDALSIGKHFACAVASDAAGNETTSEIITISMITAEETPAPDVEDQAPEDEPNENEDEIIIASREDGVLWRGVVPSDERGMAIPMLFQTDYPQIVCTLRGVDRSVATSGCNATSLSMVIAYLTGNTQQTPYSLFCQSVDEGRYHGAGWSHDTLSHYASSYGVKSQWIANDADAILQALRAGKPVIAHMGPGIFTSRGHYLVLRGVTEDGLVLMNDPNSRANCERAFPIENLLKQAKTSHAFMVCWTDEMEDAPETEPADEKLWGDLNNSGALDINDVQMLYEKIHAGETDESLDFNGDGRVDQDDTDWLADALMDLHHEGGNEI